MLKLPISVGAIRTKLGVGRVTSFRRKFAPFPSDGASRTPRSQGRSPADAVALETTASPWKRAIWSHWAVGSRKEGTDPGVRG